MACDNIIPISAFIFIEPAPCVHVCVRFPFYKSTSHVGLKPALLQGDPILTSYICNDSISKQGRILKLLQ